MKKIDELTLENFKFFRGLETLKFNSKNILVYGENGSGKSSLYWALYTFMQSSLKEDNEIKKYFNNQHPERLINIFKEDDDKSSIKLTLKNKLNIKSTYEISFDNINTNKGDKEILKANLASDFINYRLLSKLYNFKNSQNIEIFDMFEDEIFQYITIDGENFNNLWQRLKKGISPRPKMSDQKYKDFQKDIKDFNEKFKNYLQTLIRKTNEILKDNFKEPLVVSIDYNTEATYNDFIENSTTKRNGLTLSPKIYLTIEFSEKNHKIDKPHTFLNEARLTAIALSLRFSILKNRLITEDVLKILVLDDLLISLDMKHRIDVINFLLEDEDLKDYQIIVLTHDRGFFQLLRQKISTIDWKVFEFYNQNEKQCIKESKTELEKAKELFLNKDFEASANYLRKELEKILKQFLDPNLKCINKEFRTLEDLLNQVKNELEQEYKSQFNKIFKFKDIDKDLISKIDTNFEQDSDLNDNEKGLLRGIRKKIFEFTKNYQNYKTEELEIFDELKRIKDRILNPFSHSSEAPIFSQEVEEAIGLVYRLKEYLKNKKSTKNRCLNTTNCLESNALNNDINSVSIVIDFQVDILNKLIEINDTELLNRFLQHEILNNIEYFSLKELEKIFDELRTNLKTSLFNLTSEANIVRIFSKKDWKYEEKILWCNFIKYLYDQNKIQDPFLIQKLEEKKALKKEFGGWNNQEEYINCEIENQEEIPF